MKAITAAGAAIERELMSGKDYSMSQDSDEALARVALLAAAPDLAGQVASALREASADDSLAAVIVIPVTQIAPTVKRVIEEAADGH